MSFNTLRCNQCDFRYFNIPLIYFNDESEETRILMFPTGSVSFQDRFGRPASPAVRLKRYGWAESFYCKECQEVIEIADIEDKRCSKCNSKDIDSLSSLQDAPCPKCGAGRILTEKPIISI